MNDKSLLPQTNTLLFYMFIKVKDQLPEETKICILRKLTANLHKIKVSDYVCIRGDVVKEVIASELSKSQRRKRILSKKMDRFFLISRNSSPHFWNDLLDEEIGKIKNEAVAEHLTQKNDFHIANQNK